MRTLETRVAALEAHNPAGDAVDTILISFDSLGERGPLDDAPTATNEMLGEWRLDREPGEPVEDFRARASRLCPRNGVGVAALVEVLA